MDDDGIIDYTNEYNKGCISELKRSKKVYITAVVFFGIVLATCIFFSIVGTTQPFDNLVNESQDSPTQQGEDEIKTQSFTFIHTTDIHGWIAGHTHETEYNADFGDFASLMEHLLHRDDTYVLLFDSGDIIEGTGLSDIPEIHGEKIFPILKKIPGFGALTSGNHDLGEASSVSFMEENFIPFFNDPQSDKNGRYITGNTIKANSGQADDQPLGERYSIHEVAPFRFLLLGFLYDFAYYANNTEVITVEKSLKEPWFSDAMNEPDIDLIVVTVHIDPQSANLDQIYYEIRKYHKETPLLIFSGHRHILYYDQLDKNAHTVESGRYFEHIGVVNFQLQEDNKAFLNFTYQFVETSVQNFIELSNTSEDSFVTDLGNEVKDLIQEYMDELHLNTVLGCSLKTYRTNGTISDANSLYKLYLDEVLPSVIVTSNSSVANTFICNSASLRYDLYQGEVNKNDIYTISPFKDTFYYVPSLSASDTRSFFVNLNNQDLYKSKHDLDRFPYRRETVSSDRFYRSSIEIDDGLSYNIICEYYDVDTLQKIYDYTFPESGKVFTPYPTILDSTTALDAYVSSSMKCSVDCPCPAILG